MPVKVTEAILEAVEQADAWQNWVSGMSPQALESLNPTPHNIFMRFDPVIRVHAHHNCLTTVNSPADISHQELFLGLHSRDC